MTEPDQALAVSAEGRKLTSRQRHEAEAKRVMCAAWADAIGPIRIMAITDGYAMARRPGCMPFVKHLSEFGKTIHIDDAAGRAALAQETGHAG